VKHIDYRSHRNVYARLARNSAFRAGHIVRLACELHVLGGHSAKFVRVALIARSEPVVCCYGGAQGHSEPAIPRKVLANSTFWASHSAKFVRVALIARSEPVVCVCIAHKARSVLVVQRNSLINIRSLSSLLSQLHSFPLFTPPSPFVHTVFVACLWPPPPSLTPPSLSGFHA